MKLSFVIPAWNEEKLLGGCLTSIASAVERNNRPDFESEIIVVDNNSTDATAEIATRAGAQVVFEPVNQIARARNRGAEAATGDWLVFIDADCELSAGLLRDVLRLVDDGSYAGCGSLVRMDGLPVWGRALLNLWHGISVLMSWAAGAFIVCRADAFRAIGGFSDELFVTEELDFSKKLKKYAIGQGLSFCILRDHPLATSNRKQELYGDWLMLKQILRLMLRPYRSIRDRKYLSIWYDGRR